MKWSLTFADEGFIQYILVLVYNQTKTIQNENGN